MRLVYEERIFIHVALTRFVMPKEESCLHLKTIMMWAMNHGFAIKA